MIELAVKQVKKQFGETIIFENITFEVKSGERVGLIGGNGVGKTTLMKIIMGDESNEGQVFLRRGAAIGYLNQIPDYPDDMISIDVMKQAFTPVYKLKSELEELERFMSKPGQDIEKLIKLHGDKSLEFERLNGYMIDTELNKIIQGLKLDQTLLNRKFNLLSGGEQTRIVLGKILLERPDILLLDEPSNHLDIKSIEWLENYLGNYEGAALIISHDRYFLDQVVNKIVELTFDEAIVYHGNYTYYTAEKERRFLLAMKYYEQHQKKIKRMEEQIKRYRIWGEMRDSDKMYKRAKELEKRLEKMDKLKKPVYENRKVRMGMVASGRSGKKVFELEHVAKAFHDHQVLNDVSFDVKYEDFMCILGDNGSGKSTLFNIIAQAADRDKELAADLMKKGDPKEQVSFTGKVRVGSRVHMAYLPQRIEFDHDKMTVLEYFQSQHTITTSEARNELAKALFVKDDVFKQVSVLSGGEKSRLKLATLMYGGVNTLLLDEPTNHLDIDSREVLEENLLDFQGSILFISHDRYFVDKMASKIGHLKDGHIKVFDGNYLYYKEETEKLSKIEQELASQLDTQSKGLAKQSNDKTDQKDLKDDSLGGNTLDLEENPHQSQEGKGKKLSKNAQKKLKAVEEDIEALEAEIEGLESSLLELGDRLDELNETLSQIEDKKNKLDELYHIWEQLTF